MSLDYFKIDINVWAVKNRWRFDQFQHAEDYIDVLRKKGIDAEPPSELDAEKALYIKEAFSKKSD